MTLHPNSLANLKPRWTPGTSGNPKGRPPAGLTIREELNRMSEAHLTEADLRRIMGDSGERWTTRAAAARIVRLLEVPDLADFEGLLDGTETLADLRARGVNTDVIKKVRRKIRVVAGVTETTTEVELHDRAGTDFDRIVNTTDGTPTQRVQTDGTMEITAPIPDDVRAALDDIERGLLQ